MNNKIYLNDLGILNSQASGKDAVFEALISGRRDVYDSIPVDGVSYTVRKYSEYPKSQINRINFLLEEVCKEISPTVDLLIKRFGESRIGVILGSTDNGSEQSLNALKSYYDKGEFPEGYELADQQAHSPADFVRGYFNLESISTSISTACTSSGSAIILAKKMLDISVLDAVIVGGVDIVSDSVLKGFISLDAVDPGKTNPFSKNRKGINLGEGAALFVMSREVLNDNNIEFSGYGESSDAYHTTAPDPEGLGATRAMKSAMEMAGLKSVDYINLHGTGTILNDSMESLATSRACPVKPPASSTKPMVGHTLGAASAVELGFCWLLLSYRNRDNVLPVHFWDGVIDDNIADINFVKPDNKDNILQSCMSNSYAFGGCNVSLIISRGRT